MDTLSLAKLDLVHPVVKERGLQLDTMLEADGIHYRVTRGLATFAEQFAIYAKGRTMPGPSCVHDGVARPVGSCPTHPMGLTVTNAKPLDSMHVYGFAIDGVPDIAGLPTWQPDWNGRDARWNDFLAKAKSCGFAEGATWRTFPDSPHLYPQELPADPDDEMKQIMTEKGITAVWEWFDSKFGISQ